MGRIAFAYGNLTDSSTFSGGGWSVGNPLTNMQQRKLSSYAQASSSSPTDTQFIVDHGSAKAARVFGLFAHNIIDPAATITVSRGTTSGGAEVYNGSAVTCWPFTPINSVYSSFFGIIVVTPAETTARYTKIAINGSSILRIGRLFIGPVFLSTYNATALTDDWLPDFSTIERTESGADWVASRSRLRSAQIAHDAMLSEPASLMREIQRTHGITSEVVYIPDVDDPIRTQQYGFLGTMRTLSPLECNVIMRRGIAIGIDERGGAP